MQRNFLIFTVVLSLLVTSCSFGVPKVQAACVSETPMDVSAISGENPGEVTLLWNQPGAVTKYSLTYGYADMPHTFGVVSIPKETRSFTIQSLQPGIKYSFQVWSYCDNKGPATGSTIVSATAKGTVMSNALSPTQTP